MTMGGGGDEVKETAQKRALAKVAVERYERYDQVFKPLENKFIANRTGPDARRRMQGKAGREAAIKSKMVFGKANEKALTAGNNGAGPGSGSFANEITGGNEAAATGLSQVDGRNIADSQMVGEKQNIIRMGRGKEIDGLNGMVRAASRAGERATARAHAASSRSDRYAEAIGTVAGMGTSAYMNRTPVPQNAGGLETYAYKPPPEPTIKEYTS